MFALYNVIFRMNEKLFHTHTQTSEFSRRVEFDASFREATLIFSFLTYDNYLALHRSPSSTRTQFACVYETERAFLADKKSKVRRA
jgi:hypothetical protein